MSNYLVLVIAAFVILLGSISNSAVTVAFPVIMSSLDASLISASWILSMNQLVFTVGMPLAGKASDVFGRKFIFMLCLFLFAAGSLLCALAPNIWVLIFARFIQGLGSSGFVPSAVATGAEALPKYRLQAIGLLSSIFPIGTIIGPNLGGWLTSAFGWRYLFWFNVPFCLIIFIAAAFILRSQPKQKTSLDMVGAGLFTGAISGVMVGLSSLGNTESGVSWILVGLLFALSVIFMIAFVYRENRVANPVIDLKMFRHKPFVATDIYNFIYGGSVMGVQSLIPLYAYSVYGISILEIGILLTARSVMMILGSLAASFSLMRWGYRKPILLGTIAVVISMFLFGAEFTGIDILGIHLGSSYLLAGILAFLGLGAGIATPAANNACIELMPDKVGTITGIRGMFRMSGAAIATALAALLLHNVGDMALGFSYIFYGLAVILILVLPVIFMIPSSPKVSKKD